MGIEFKNVDLKNNEIVELEDRNRRKSRKKQENDVDKLAKSIIRKPTKGKARV